MTRISEPVARMLSTFTEVFPAFSVSARGARIWNGILSRYSADELRAATEDVVLHWRYGAPTIAAVRESIEGHVEQRRRAKTDVWGNALPGQYEHYEATIGLDGRERDPRPALGAGEPAAPPPGVSGLLEGIGRDPFSEEDPERLSDAL